MVENYPQDPNERILDPLSLITGIKTEPSDNGEGLIMQVLRMIAPFAPSQAYAPPYGSGQSVYDMYRRHMDSDATMTAGIRAAANNRLLQRAGLAIDSDSLAWKFLGGGVTGPTGKIMEMIAPWLGINPGQMSVNNMLNFNAMNMGNFGRVTNITQAEEEAFSKGLLDDGFYKPNSAQVDFRKSMGYMANDLSDGAMAAVRAGLMDVRGMDMETFGRNVNRDGNLARILRSGERVFGTTNTQDTMAAISDLVGNSRIDLNNEGDQQKVEDLLRNVKSAAKSAGVSMDAMRQILGYARDLAEQSKGLNGVGGVELANMALGNFNKARAIAASIDPYTKRQMGGEVGLTQALINHDEAVASTDTMRQISAAYFYAKDDDRKKMDRLIQQGASAGDILSASGVGMYSYVNGANNPVITGRGRDAMSRETQSALRDLGDENTTRNELIAHGMSGKAADQLLRGIRNGEFKDENGNATADLATIARNYGDRFEGTKYHRETLGRMAQDAPLQANLASQLPESRARLAEIDRLNKEYRELERMGDLVQPEKLGGFQQALTNAMIGGFEDDDMLGAISTFIMGGTNTKLFDRAKEIFTGKNAKGEDVEDPESKYSHAREKMRLNEIDDDTSLGASDKAGAKAKVKQEFSDGRMSQLTEELASEKYANFAPAYDSFLNSGGKNAAAFKADMDKRGVNLDSKEARMFAAKDYLQGVGSADDLANFDKTEKQLKQEIKTAEQKAELERAVRRGVEAIPKILEELQKVLSQASPGVTPTTNGDDAGQKPAGSANINTGAK